MIDTSTVDTKTAIESAIRGALPDATIEVRESGGGHFSLVVTATAFQARSMLESHRLVYAAVAPLMAGPSAPVHAIDTLKTIAR
jgi:stress-induced morphogen